MTSPRLLPCLPLCILAAVSCAGAPPAPAASKPGPEKKAAAPKTPRKERGQVSSISLERLFELQQSGSVLIYDARPAAYYRQGHITGAISMPKAICDDVISLRKPELNTARAAGRPVVVYCSGFFCADARTVARHLAHAGYSASIFSGGWDAWTTAGLPTE